MTQATTDAQGIAAALRACADPVLVSAHENPDGDAVGSLLAMCHLVRAIGKRAACVTADPVPDIYCWLPGVECIQRPDEVEGPFNTLVIVDASRRSRLGATADLAAPPVSTLVIDHHRDDAPEGEHVWLDPSYAAVGEMLYELYVASAQPVPPGVAQALYVAVATDTGSFRYPSTTARSHRIVGDLIEAGADPAAAAHRVFDAMSPEKLAILNRVLNRMDICLAGRAAFSYVTPEDMAETGADAPDLNNLINYGRNVNGVQVAILFRSTGPETTKISIRSRPEFDARRVAAHFGGGGHPGAAGATLEMPLENAREAVTERVRHCLEGPE
jgi:phosphoesterase RecJ-like protein